MPDTPAESDCSACEPTKPRHSRLRGVEPFSAVANALEDGVSQRCAATRAGVARGTLRYWERRRVHAAPPESALAVFMETPEGVRWLRQMVVAGLVQRPIP
ncbi:hypothetical protein [Allochromatium palmeri]|uniref:Uncharacterized protein n=1 Tax=Allochromatium palmeri TaxID=231048 RepID=A0A6N8EE75_9GAMM|nr:hypothetical protein [Allochromatium palmeri]MTW22535.1 hypothetical protein [Allochromatium palmeri]